MKANVLFFDKKPASETPWTKQLWVYDLRTNRHFTLKTNPLPRSDLDDFVEAYKAGRPQDRVATWREDAPDRRWRAYSYEELAQRDKLSLDLTWIRDEEIEDAANLPSSDVIAAEILEDLRAALEEFEGRFHALQPKTEALASQVRSAMVRQRTTPEKLELLGFVPREGCFSDPLPTGEDASPHQLSCRGVW